MPCRGTAKGGLFSFRGKRIAPPYTPQEKGTRGLPPRPRTLAVSILKSCSACGIGCGVHGFAMNPCISLLLSTAPYYREARVTIAWRQTACRMRHCCARRIVETGSRRELLRTSTRWAERQRMIGAEANRIAVPTRLCRAQASPFRRHRSHSSPRLPINPFLLGVQGGYSLSEEREYPPFFAPRTVRGTPLPFRAKRKNKTYLAAGSIFRSYSPSSTARRSLTLPSSASSIVWISASRSRLSVPPRGR